ncbi:MAG: SDR family NAD(P)-dependent oxidoreductase [Pseudomonadota bacterium]|nr:SDR family NAD(P)-dependent oxidoreductase [Pseudomonadota bacterium]
MSASKSDSHMQDRVIWITGASSGIGKALTRQLVQHNQVIATARSEDKLAQLQAEMPQLKIIPADVTQPDQLAAAAQQIETDFGHLDLLIANAGHCEYLDVRQFDSALVRRMMEVNFMGFIHTLEVALPLLRRSRYPQLAAMSSSSVYAGLPRAEAYSASKAAITQFMESLAADLRPEGFSLSVIHPGFVDTDLTRNNNFPMPLIMAPDQAASRIIRGLARQRFNIDFPKGLTWTLRFLKTIPYVLRHRITASMSRNTQHES